MFRPRLLPASDRRRAVILMVVLVLLTLFAIVGLAFVLYADAEAQSSRVYREANATGNPFDEDPNTLASYGLGQILFDLGDPSITASNPYPIGAWSALRGHSVGRDIYGWNSDNAGSNIYPFNGVGRLHTGAASYQNPFNVDDHNLINYVPFGAVVNGQFVVTDQFVRDPERLGMRQGLNALGTAAGPYTGGWNPAYTYPDGNHVYLGAVDFNGNVLARSFHRPYFIPNSPSNTKPYFPLGQHTSAIPNDPNDPNINDWSWSQDQNPWDPTDVVPAWLRYAILRPRNKDMAPGFPLPGLGGDVKNLVGYPGPNDSIWVDLDYPVKVMPDGTKYKPLFAFLIVDLDGRVNLNVHGNIRGQNNTHMSNQGWGKWEINPAHLSPNGNVASQAEWAQLTLGSALAPTVRGRYGLDLQPTKAGNVAQSGRFAHVYGQVDVDANNDGQGGVATQPMQLGAAYSCFPTFPAGYSNGVPLERTNHPMLFDPNYPQGDDRRFGASNLVGLFNYGSLDTAATSTPIGQLLPINMGSFRERNMVTTDSYHLDRPGLSPWLFDPYNTTGNTNTYGYPTGNANKKPPNGTPIAFPSLALRTGNVPAGSEFNVPGTSYFLPSPPAPKPNTIPNPAIDWRSVVAALGKVDVNRFLPPYPHQGRGILPTGYDAKNNPLGYDPTPLTGPGNNTPQGYNPDQSWRYDDPTNPNLALIQTQFQQAHAARQKLADDIYRRLLVVTGVPAAANPANPQPQDLAPRRWLAQLAVNIVDFIDDDDMVTPFNFYTTADGLGAANVGDLNNNPNTGAQDRELPKYWVFGTELPKVQVNEVLGEFTIGNKPNAKGNVKVDVNVWVELVNALPSLGAAFPATVQQQDNLPIPLAVAAAGAAPAYAPYQVVIADSLPANAGLLAPPSAAPYNNDLVLGTPNQVRTAVGDADFTNAALTQTIDKKPAAAQISTAAPTQFFLLGPGVDQQGTVAVPAKNSPGVVPAGTPMLTSPSMHYQADTPLLNKTAWTINNKNIKDNTTGVGVLLRRLTNPHLPFNDTLMINGNPNPSYNPYLTIDYIQSVPLHDTTQKAAYYSTAKLQPYAADPSQITTTDKIANGALTTFGSNNQVPAAGQPNPSYDWLVHLDRQVINPMELLHVSGFRPHQLTHEFITNKKFTHLVDWHDPANRLYRAFEFLSTPDRTNGVSQGGRVPGMMNINTIWDPRVFQALCDAQASNGFNAATVTAVFNKMIAQRSPGLAAPPGTRAITGRDRPFLGMGVGNLPVNDPQAVYDDGTPKTTNTGIEDTFLRSGNGSGNVGAARLFTVPGNHIYQQTELLTKIYGNVTTRSNVFAVWTTVGFFRVADDTVRPVKLAEEIGASNGTPIRHRMFAVIDRSRMTIGPPGLNTTTPATLLAGVGPTSPATPMAVQVSAASGTTLGATAGGTNIPWQLQPVVVQPPAPNPPIIQGSAAAPSVLVIDAGQPNEETVVLQSQPPPNWAPAANLGPGSVNYIVATFLKPHGAGATITIPGNPGPQSSFSISGGSSSGLVIAYQVLQ